MVELAPAVVRDVDHVDTVLHAERRVFGGGDAFQAEGDRMRVLDVLDEIPRHAGLVVEARRALAPRLDVARGDVALAPAVVGGIDGDDESGVAVIDRALHDVVHPRRVAPHVELEDARVVRGLRGLLETGEAHRAQHLEDAELAGGARDGGTAARVERFEPANGRREDGQAQRSPEERRRQVDLGDVAQHPRAKGDGVEGLPIPAHRRFRFGAADQVVPRPLRQAAARSFDDLVQVLEAVFES